MTILLAFLAITTSLLIIFSDKIINHYFPNNNFVEFSDEMDLIIENIE